MTHKNYRMGFFLVIILDTILVYSELVLGIYITETESCHCDIDEIIQEEFPALNNNSTESTQTYSTIQETESPALFEGVVDCDTLSKLTRSWKRSKISRSNALLKIMFSTLNKVCAWNYDL